jgi:hypothetical protein
MNMKSNLLVTIALFLFQNSPAQFESTDSDSRASAMGGAFVSLVNNSSAVFYNPSGLGQLNKRYLSLYYEPSVFGLKEISTAAITYAEAFKFGTIGIGLRSFGFDLYRESKITLAFGDSYREMMFWGVGLNYYNLSISGYGSASTTGIDAGALVKFGEYLSWGFSARNIAGAKIGSSKQTISRTYVTGFRFNPLDMTNILIEVEKDVEQPVCVRFGAEISPVRMLNVRAGISSEPVSYSAGAGFRHGIFCLDFSFTITEPLGMSNRLNISLDFDN